MPGKMHALNVLFFEMLASLLAGAARYVAFGKHAVLGAGWWAAFLKVQQYISIILMLWLNFAVQPCFDDFS